jgi:hypothetical protein
MAVIRCGGDNNDSYIAVFTFLLIVGVCSYVVLNPGSLLYSGPMFRRFCSVRGDSHGCSSLEDYL